MLRTKRKSTPRAESLSEVIIAFTIIAMVMTAAAMAIGNSYRKQRIVREENQAAALADEGATAIRILRNTNWLRFPGDRANCWDTMDATSASACAATASTKLADGQTYRVYRELSDSTALMSWNIDLVTPPATDTRLYSTTLGGFTFYTHTATATPTPFYRTISIARTADEIEVTSTVTWESYGVARSSTINRRLKNF